ncbi:hypothetical protein C8N35_102395 [Breoghania corrubedonensis]|uniref:Uncharacterized protein n=1 Tax=Breoghania corrubedonensis TaxID=665038 RepID=A0A2T5VD48_9HYPH|nr:hypothetical protein [Breoghania corrubedonensis]PTW61680.1 hypothetical protein C8N35_102395 [Breoghania corrubedonensis]
MPANTLSSSHLEKALEVARAEREIATARLCRLYRDAFEDGDRAIRTHGKLIAERGVDATIRILEQDDGLFGRSWHFGWMRGGMLAQGNREEALASLRELPEAVREHHSLFVREKDLERAYEAAREREGRQHIRAAKLERLEPDRERDR